VVGTITCPLGTPMHYGHVGFGGPDSECQVGDRDCESLIL
jgi:hypothetical protein